VIHYHGTPVSGSRLDAARFLAGRHALIPFARPDDLGVALDVCQSVILDNSAFSLWRAGGGDVDVAAYRGWAESLARHPAVDFCLIPDKIDGSEADNVALVTLWLRLGCRLKSVPVWHYGESLEWLGYLVEHFQTVALGSSGLWSTPGTRAWWERTAAAMAVACDAQGRPRARLHGLRMLDPEIFSRLPLASADSANAAVNGGSVGRFGSYPPPTAGQRAAVIASIVEASNSPGIWQAPPQLGLELGASA
jgi:hypothetical protein